MALVQRHRTIFFVATTLFAVALSVISGCQEYGAVSPRACAVAMALYSTCNRSDTARLTKIEGLIAAGEATSEISAREAEWLQTIVDTARAGEWNDAMLDARTMLDEQVTD